MPEDHLHYRNNVAYIDETDKTLLLLLLLLLLLSAVCLWMCIETLWLFLDTHNNNDCCMIMTAAIMFSGKYLDLERGI